MSQVTSPGGAIKLTRDCALSDYHAVILIVWVGVGGGGVAITVITPMLAIVIQICTLVRGD